MLPSVLSSAVLFTGFSELSLDSGLRVFRHDVLSKLAVGAGLRPKMFERFGEEAIAIPSPQRDLHIKLPPRLNN